MRETKRKLGKTKVSLVVTSKKIIHFDFQHFQSPLTTQQRRIFALKTFLAINYGSFFVKYPNFLE